MRHTNPSPRTRRSTHQWRAATACLLLLTPMPASKSDPDRTGETSLTVGAGSGGFGREVWFHAGMSSCGPITRTAHFDADFTDYGAAVEHCTGKKGRIGLRAGFIRERVGLVPGQQFPVNVDSIATAIGSDTDNIYVNPYIAAEGTWFGSGVGVILASERLRLGEIEHHPEDIGSNVALSGHLRVGKRSLLYASASAGESVPIYSGGGFFNYGIGVDIPVGLDLWAGKAQGPWLGDDFLLKATVHPSRRWSVGASLRFRGEAPRALPDSDREYGVSLSITRRFLDG